MNDSQDRLREMLHRRGDRVHSSLSIADIRDAGMRDHRHRMRLIGPMLVAASVAALVLLVALTGRTSNPSTPPAGPGASVSHTVGPTSTVAGLPPLTAPLSTVSPSVTTSTDATGPASR